MNIEERIDNLFRQMQKIEEDRLRVDVELQSILIELMRKLKKWEKSVK